jgi:hypothetical protein
MAKAKKKAASTVQIQLNGAVDEVDASEDWDYRAAIEQIDQQDGVRFQITRIAPKESHGFVGEILPAEFSAQTLLERFGPGVYRIRALGPNNLYVAGGGRMTIGPTLTRTTTPSPPPQTDVAAVLLQLDERRTREQREATDRYIRWAAILGPIVTPLLTKLLGGNAVNDVVGLVVKLKELNPQQSDDRLDVFLRALEYARDNDRGGTGSDTSWLGFAREALETVRPAVAGFFTPPVDTATPSASVRPIVRLPAQPTPPPSVGHGPAPVVEPASPTQPSSSNGSNPMIAKLLPHIPWLRGTLAQLIYQAAASKNPELYAEVVLDNLPRNLEPRDFHSLIASDDWWTWLRQFAPDVAPHEQWFAAFRAEVLSMLEDEKDSPPASEGEREAAGDERADP